MYSVCMYELLYRTVTSWLLRSALWLSPGLSPGRAQCVAFLGKTLTVLLSTLVYKLGTSEFNVGGNPAMD